MLCLPSKGFSKRDSVPADPAEPAAFTLCALKVENNSHGLTASGLPEISQLAEVTFTKLGADPETSMGLVSCAGPPRPRSVA
jgi:hypothetical protein